MTAQFSSLFRVSQPRSSATGFLLGLAVFLGGLASAEAQDPVTLKIATQAPVGSPWHRAFEAWAGSVAQESEGKLRLQFFYGGSQGDERDYVRKMEQGQLDGASVTTTGLSHMARSVLVLSAPGVFREYAQIDRVRRRLATRFETEFDEAGYHFVAWGDIGKARFFSNTPIRRPADLGDLRLWARPDDPIVNKLYQVAGATPQRLGINEVLPALQTGRLNAFPAPALAAVSLQWYHHATHMSEQGTQVVVGATVFRKAKYESLSAELRQILDDTGVRAHRLLTRSIRRADQRAFETLRERGVTAVSTEAFQEEWDEVSAQTRRQLAGRLFPRELLEQVERIAAQGSN